MREAKFIEIPGVSEVFMAGGSEVPLKEERGDYMILKG